MARYAIFCRFLKNIITQLRGLQNLQALFDLDIINKLIFWIPLGWGKTKNLNKET